MEEPARAGLDEPVRQGELEVPRVIAKAAGKVGFDEIQFDYVRFPTDGDLSDVKLDRSSPKMEATIAGFLKYAVGELHPLKLRVSADLFGLAATRDLGIGQNPRKLRDIVDVMSPMIYPQGYGSGEYGIHCPVCNPRDTIEATMADWKKAAVNGTAELRPWIQAYDWLDHPYGRRPGDGQVSGAARPTRTAASCSGTRRPQYCGRRTSAARYPARAPPVSTPGGSRPRARARDPRLPRRRLLRRRLRLDEVAPRRQARAVPVRPRPRGPGRPGPPRAARSRRDGRAGLRGGAPDGLNCLAGMRYAVGSLDRVHCLIRNLCLSRRRPTSPTCTWSRPAAPICCATCSGRMPAWVAAPTIGVQSLAHDHCFECWLEVELARDLCLTGSPTPAAEHAIATPHAAASAAGDASSARRHGLRCGARGRRGADRLLPAHVRGRRRHHRARGHCRTARCAS